VKLDLDEKTVPLMGVTGAFVFAAQMINFTIPVTGSSGHLAGGLLLAILLGPHAAFLVMASVLTVQALLFADGGLLALGCNIWNLGLYPCFIAYPLLYRPLARGSRTPVRVMAASVAAAVVGLQLGAFSVVLETVFSGRSDIPAGTFLLLMQPVHLAIGLVEGLITAGVVGFVKTVRPEMLEDAAAAPRGGDAGLRRLALGFLVLAFLTGGVLSWFASANPDGLEWALARVTGPPGLHEHETGVAAGLRRLQETVSILPGYSLRSGASGTAEVGDERPWPSVDPATSIAGVLGAATMVGFMFAVGVGIRAIRRKAARW
jgi:cobalt/nickel transport system permease protein